MNDLTKKPSQCADCPYMLPSGFDVCPLCPAKGYSGWDIAADAERFLVELASGIEARSDETAQQAQPEGQEPGPQGDANPPPPPTGDDNV